MSISFQSLIVFVSIIFILVVAALAIAIAGLVYGLRNPTNNNNGSTFGDITTSGITTNGNSTINGNSSISGNLFIGEESTFTGLVSVNDLTSNGVLTSQGNTIVNSNLNVAGTTTMVDVTSTGTMNITGETIVSNSLTANSFTASSSGITLSGGGTSLNYYQEFLASTTGVNITLNSPVTLLLTRVGRIVTCSISTISGAATGSNLPIQLTNGSSGNPIPTAFLPNIDQNFYLFGIYPGTTWSSIFMIIPAESNTPISFWSANNTGFSSPNSPAVNATTVTWVV